MRYLIKYELKNSKQIFIYLILNYAVITFLTAGILSFIFNSILIYIFVFWRGYKLIKDINTKHNLIEHLLPVDRQVFILSKIVSSVILFIPILTVILLF